MKNARKIHFEFDVPLLTPVDFILLFSQRPELRIGCRLKLSDIASDRHLERHLTLIPAGLLGPRWKARVKMPVFSAAQHPLKAIPVSPVY